MIPQDPHAALPGEAGADAPRQHLSALLDGSCHRDPQGDGASAVQRACALWRDDAQARQDWHTWNLIGDVMRSDELARRPARDAAFLARLRERLADEPVVLAPAAVAPDCAPVVARGWRQAWRWPSAVAAGFVLVAGVLVVARTVPPQTAPTLASNSVPGLSVASVPGASPSSAPAVGGLIRDSRLDSYLRAHQTARGSPAAAVPGGGMRNVEVTLNRGTER